MGTITSDIGLISGINIRQLIDQLMAIESRPLYRAEERIAALQFQQTAFLDINARLLSLGNLAGAFRVSSIFQSAKATSSDTDVLTASANEDAAVGTYNLTVHRLVSTHQEISRGFADKDSGAIGADAFTFEIGGGQLAVDTELAYLNSSTGVDRGSIRIEDSQGNSATIDLSTAVTVSDVIEAINSDSTLEVTATVDDDHFVITDDNAGAVTVSDVYGSSTATSLGIAGSGTGSITGSSVFGLSVNTALSSLNDATGILITDGADGATYDMQITVGGTSAQIALGELVDGDGEVVQARAVTIGDVIDRINEELAGSLTASVSADGKRLELTATNPADTITVTEIGSSTTARDLGILGTDTGAITGDALIAGLNSTLVGSLNGGSGLGAATDITITDRAGNAFSSALDVSSYVSVDALIVGINAQAQADGVSVTASLNGAGNGLLITDTSGGSGNLQISGDAADALGLTADVADTTVGSGSLQTRYVAEATLLSSLNAGQGVGTGSFVITDAYGAASTITVDEDVQTVQDLISLINSRGIQVEASINENGDGILLTATDNGGGPGALVMSVEDSDGSVASKLNLAGEAESALDNTIDGSFERSIEFDDTDTLQDIADKINAASAGVQAVIINDGTGGTPYHLSIVSAYSGRAGQMTIDTGDVDMGLSTLTEAQDAIVFFGSSNPADAILLSSSSNTLDQAIEGVTIDLNSTSSESVELVIARDTSRIEQSITDFVDQFNDVLGRLDYYDSYDADSEQRGILLGDPTVARMRSSLYNTIQDEAYGIDSQYTMLTQVGVRIGAGGQLEFDKDVFRTALENDPAGVADLFAAREEDTEDEIEILPGITTPNTETSFSQLGVAEQIKELAEDFTNAYDGLLTQHGSSIDSLIRLQRGVIEDLNVKLENRRTSLERQFIAMEQALAALQSQQGALSMITTVG
ncbi:MAG: flagellar filament capping protein FliD [Phycisphaerales bacterium]|nr:flagellar filament capping protein FliD [Phycisphaerales bacterium]